MNSQTLEKNNIGQEVAPDILCVPIIMVNVILVGKPNADDGEWVLVDTGMPNSSDKIIEAANFRFGRGSKPGAIILTHGHFDHIGAVEELVRLWDVPVYAHKLEMPYLTGKMDYPEPDPTVGGGLLARLSPLYPKKGIDLGDKILSLPEGNSIPKMHRWRYIHTPGHTPGHISLFRESDGILISGDAIITVNQESMIDVLTQHKELNGPPAYFTTNWEEAWKSVKKLDDLNPSLVVAGHGKPMSGEELRKQLEELSECFDVLAIPDQGKYVHK